MEHADHQLRFPIGAFENPDMFSQEKIESWIETLASFPDDVQRTIKNLNDAQLNNRYRPDGWTIRQVIHHCADSHMNSYIRFKLSITENRPVIKPYREELWAELSDAKELPVDISIQLLKALHERWIYFLRHLSEEDWNKKFKHPETKTLLSLKLNLAYYAWHCEHHLAHINNAIDNPF